MREMATSLFDAFARGIISAAPGRTFPLADAAGAHAALEARSDEGPFILIPEGSDA
jgi:NADPH2:quinone reductase